jgi:hypothetical protein
MSDRASCSADDFRRRDDLAGMPLGVLGGVEEQPQHG